MTKQTRRGKPPTPEQERDALLADLDVLVARRQVLTSELDDVNAQCRALVIDLMRRGVPPVDLVNRPFSRALIGQIRDKEDLTYYRRASKA